MNALWNMMSAGQMVKILMVSGLWFLLSCSSSFGDERDVACLRSIRDSLLDPHGYFNSSWNFNNSTEGFICSFMGVECWHPAENRVFNLRLSDIGLKGRFPVGLKNCTSVTGIDLSRNEFYGPLPSDISYIITFVTTLDLSTNNFSREIPVNLANCTYLNSLKLDHNQFTGQIPPELGLLSRLEDFSVTNNLLTGPVPVFSDDSSIGVGSYANNPGLCGKLLDPCPGTTRTSHTGVIIGAAIGGITVAAIGVGIAMLFYYRKMSNL